MRRSYVQIDGVLYEKGTEPLPEVHHVMGDFEPFKANDGTVIRGRAHWRDHLKATNGIEMGHSDIRAAQTRHERAKAERQEKVAQAMKAAYPVDLPYREGGQEYRRSSVAANVLNRLEGRPVPDRKTVLKIALEEARRKR